MGPFVDEIMKISAAAGKMRSGNRPLRADTLAGKERVDKTSSSLKIANYGRAIIQAAKSPAGRYGGAALGGVFAVDAARTGYGDWKTGRTYRKQMERAQRGRR